MAKLEMNIQLAAGELIAMSQSGRNLDEKAYQEVYNRYLIREDQLEVLFGMVDLEIFRRIPGFSETLYEGPTRRQ
jgi:hypothetical protein